MKKIFPNETIIVTKHFDIHQDWEVPIPAFFILDPLRPIRSFMEFSDEESIEFMKLLRLVRKGMKDVLNIEDVYFFHNEDSGHGFHFWIFPRLEWMEPFGRKIQSVRPIMNHAKSELITPEMVEKVKEYSKKMKEYLLVHWK